MRLATTALALLVLVISVPTASADLIYSFTFTGGGGMTATGTLDVLGGVAQSGSITVTGIPLEADPSTLITSAGSLLPAVQSPARNHDGDVITFDNVLNIAADPMLSSDGLGFGSGPYGPQHYNVLINIWGNSPGSYTLFVGEAQVDESGNVIGDPQWVYHMENGSFTVTPEPSTLSVLALGALALLRRR